MPSYSCVFARTAKPALRCSEPPRRRAQSALDPADLDSSKPPYIKNVHNTKFVHEVPFCRQNLVKRQYQTLGFGNLVRIDLLGKSGLRSRSRSASQPQYVHMASLEGHDRPSHI